MAEPCGRIIQWLLCDVTLTALCHTYGLLSFMQHIKTKGKFQHW